MFLYAAGCSMTFGSEMIGPDDEVILNDPELNEQRLQQAWPGRLSEKLGMDGHYNDGVGGASNTRILRRTTRWIEEEWIGKGKDPRDLFVVIGWSQLTRWEFFVNDHYATMFPMIDPVNTYDADFKRFWRMFAPVYRAETFVLWDMFVSQVGQLQAYLELNGIPYAMAYGLQSPVGAIKRHAKSMDDPDTVLKDKLLKRLKWVNQKRFLGMKQKHTGMSEVMSNGGVQDRAPNGHPYANGHEVWAEYLANWIRDKNLTGSN